MKRIISILLSFLMLFGMSACNTEPPEETTSPEAPATTASETTEEQTEPPVIDIPKARIDLSPFYIVMPEAASTQVLYAKDKLFYHVKNSVGVELKSGSASSEYEILLGDTGREESISLKSLLSENEYAISIQNKKIIIVATHDAFLYDAIENLINNNISTENGKVELIDLHEGDIDVDAGNTSSLRYLFSQSKELKADFNRSDSWPDEIVKRPEGCEHLQGGCSDGEYIYQGFILRDRVNNEKDNICKIVKIKPDFDPNTQDVVLTSGELALNHTNDLTYNSRTGEIAVAHNNPNRTKVSILDADTLEFKRSVTILPSIYSISYNYERDVYVVGISSSQNMMLLSSDLTRKVSNIIRSATGATASMTTQGICSDDTFIYHTLWNSGGKASDYNKNVITVYDWYGNHVGTIYTKITIESENIIVHGGELYVCAYSSGGVASYIYKIKPEIKN